MDGRPPALEIEGLTASYGRLVALQPIDLTVPAGGLVLIVGPNGAGKSTLVRSVAGLTARYSAHIRQNGHDVSKLSAAKRARAGIVLVPEGRGTLPGLTVEENLKIAARLGGDPLDWNEVSSYFPRLEERAWQNCSSLSGGEMQMLAIARALVARAKVLLLDEPSQGLAPLIVQEVYKALAQLNSGGMGMLLIEQKSVPLWRVPDETIVMVTGRVVHRRKGMIPESELAELYLGSDEEE